MSVSTMLGIKKEMSARFNQRGQRIPVTYILAGPNRILQVRDDKIQLGFGQKKRIKKPENAFVKAIGYAPRFVKEASIEKTSDAGQQGLKKYSIGDTITISIFEPGDELKVTGTTKGKGFAGVVKRWGFAGGPKTHGQSDRHRAPGSIGQGTTPGRVHKGKKMAGHMGAARLTIGGLEVVEVDESKNLLVVKGSIPGSKNSLVIVEKTGKVKGYVTAKSTTDKDDKEESEKTNPQEAVAKRS